MTCDRCGLPILPGQGRKAYPKDSASAAGGTVVLHEPPCRRPPTQTYPR